MRKRALPNPSCFLPHCWFHATFSRTKSLLLRWLRKTTLYYWRRPPAPGARFFFPGTSDDGHHQRYPHLHRCRVLQSLPPLTPFQRLLGPDIKWGTCSSRTRSRWGEWEPGPVTALWGATFHKFCHQTTSPQPQAPRRCPLGSSTQTQAFRRAATPQTITSEVTPLSDLIVCCHQAADLVGGTVRQLLLGESPGHATKGCKPAKSHRKRSR